MESDYPTSYQRAGATGEIWLPIIWHKDDRISKFAGLWEYYFWFGRRPSDGADDGHRFSAYIKRKTDGKRLRFEVTTCSLDTFDDSLYWNEKDETLPREWRLAVMANILQNAFGLGCANRSRIETKEIQPLI